MYNYNIIQIDNSTDNSSVFKRLGSSTSTCCIAKAAAMHGTWRSKELHCQSNKYQAASEAGESEVFASPRPLSSLYTRCGRDGFVNLNPRNVKLAP